MKAKSQAPLGCSSVVAGSLTRCPAKEKSIFMKIGVNFLPWAAAMNDQSLGLIEKAAGLGIDGIEFFIDEPRNINSKAIRKAAHDLGLGITCCTMVGPQPVRETGES